MLLPTRLGTTQVGVAQDKFGRVTVDHEFKTNVPGVWAASQICTFIFPIANILTSIPVFSIIIRYNLLENKIVNKCVRPVVGEAGQCPHTRARCAALAASLPTVVVYVIDTPRCVSPVTFMSNMLYSCSILYKSRLPFVVAFNKVDVEPHDFAVEWMERMAAFRPHLGGAVWHGTATRLSDIYLQFCLPGKW